MTILRAGFSGSHPTATAVFLAALIVLFCGSRIRWDTSCSDHRAIPPTGESRNLNALTSRWRRHRGGGHRRRVRVLSASAPDGAHPCGNARSVESWVMSSVGDRVNCVGLTDAGRSRNPARRASAPDDHVSVVPDFADRVTGV